MFPKTAEKFPPLYSNWPTGIYSSQCTSFLPNSSEYYAQKLLISVNMTKYMKLYVKTSKIWLRICKSTSFLPSPPSSKCEVYIPVNWPLNPDTNTRHALLNKFF